MPSATGKRPVQLTPRQHQILEAISGFQQNRCYSPTIAELSRDLGISRSTVFEHIAELRAKGLLTTCPGKARSSMLTSPGQRLLKRIQSQVCDHAEADPNPGNLPLLGRVAAGCPVEAVQERQALSWQGMFGSDESLFSLQVKGDSMIEEDIQDGDYVICRRTQVARNGDLVVAIVDDGDTTLKRFYRESDRVRLQPANSAYAPIYSNNCRIDAVVVGLLRRL